MFDVQKIIDELIAWSPKLAGALLILIIGMWIANNLAKLASKGLEKAKVDKTLRPFLVSLVSVLLKVMVVIAAAGIIGIETTSFVAILASAGLAIGLALQGSLQNFASGVMILFFKPYKVGDLVTIQGFTGVINEIQIFNTVIMTPDNKKVIVPNASATSAPIVNISGPGLIRIDLTFGISYSTNIDKAREVIQAVADANDKILKKPGIDIFVSGHGASAIELAVRPHCHPDHYWDVYFYMHEELKKAFDKNGITIPFTTYNVNMLGK